MRATNLWKALVLAALVSLCANSPAVAQTPDHGEPNQLDELATDIQIVDQTRLDRLLEGYRADEDLQTERPEWVPEARETRPQKPRRSNAFAQWLASFFSATGSVFGYLLLAAIILAIAAALYFIFGESLTLRRRQKPEKVAPTLSEVPDLRPQQAAAMTLLEDADALAAAGRFAEAVHLLLFRSIDDIQQKQQGSIARSLTAREIGRLETLPGRVRKALLPIITIVERSFFGGRKVDEAGWKTARASYHDFAFGQDFTAGKVWT